MSNMHSGYLKQKNKNTFLNSGLTDVDIATMKVYNGVKPMWAQLGFLNNNKDNPGEDFYWKNYITKNHKFKYPYIEGIIVEPVESGSLLSGSFTPPESYEKIVINENSNQNWMSDASNTYYYPDLPIINKYGVFTDTGIGSVLFGSKTTWDGDDTEAPITNTHESDMSLVLDLDFQQKTTDDINDKTEFNIVNYNSDFNIELDENLRLEKVGIDIPDVIDKSYKEQAY